MDDWQENMNDWQENLETVLKKYDNGLLHTTQHAIEFFDFTVKNAFEKITDELEKYDRSVRRTRLDTGEILNVSHDHRDEDEFYYTLEAQVFPKRVRVYATYGDRRDKTTAELTSDRDKYIGLAYLHEQIIIEDFVKRYTAHISQPAPIAWRETE